MVIMFVCGIGEQKSELVVMGLSVRGESLCPTQGQGDL